MKHTISIGGDTYDALRAYCIDKDISTASLVESLFADLTGEAVAVRRRPRTIRAFRNSATIDVRREVVERIDRALAKIPAGRRPTRKRWLDEMLAAWLDGQVRS